jgi:hypothetical protein
MAEIVDVQKYEQTPKLGYNYDISRLLSQQEAPGTRLRRKDTMLTRQGRFLSQNHLQLRGITSGPMRY